MAHLAAKSSSGQAVIRILSTRFPDSQNVKSAVLLTPMLGMCISTASSSATVSLMRARTTHGNMSAPACLVQRETITTRLASLWWVQDLDDMVWLRASMLLVLITGTSHAGAMAGACKTLGCFAWQR